MRSSLSLIGLGEIRTLQLEVLRDSGVGEVDLVPDNFGPIDSESFVTAERIAVALGEHGLKVGSIQGAFFSCDIRNGSELEARILRITRLCEISSSKTVVVGSPDNRVDRAVFKYAVLELKKRLRGISEVLVENICSTKYGGGVVCDPWILDKEECEQVWDYANAMNCMSAGHAVPTISHSTKLVHLSGLNHLAPGIEDLHRIEGYLRKSPKILDLRVSTELLLPDLDARLITHSKVLRPLVVRVACS